MFECFTWQLSQIVLHSEANTTNLGIYPRQLIDSLNPNVIISAII